MTIKYIKHGTQHLLTEKTVYESLNEIGLLDLLPRFSIVKSQNHRRAGKYHAVDDHLTDGKKLIILEKGTTPDPQTIEKNISDIPLGYPPIVFYGKNTVSTFIRPGRITFFATITKRNVKLHIPGGEADIPRSALPDLRINALSPDLFDAVLEHGGHITTKMYDRTAYTKAVENYEGATVIPFFDNVIIVAKNGVYIYDGGRATIRYPFTHTNDLKDFINATSIKELIEILAIM